MPRLGGDGTFHLLLLLDFSNGIYWKLFRTVGIHTKRSEAEAYEHLLN